MARWLDNLVSLLFRTNGHRKQVALPLDATVAREDLQLSEHFSLFELTQTNSLALQERNRILSNSQVAKLKVLAEHAEEIRRIVGKPVRVHSGYRSPDLNSSISGSSLTSQHPRCEAIDFTVAGRSVEESFNLILAAARSKNFKFGQLILERAARSYGVVSWVHCSVVGTLAASKVGQVLKMEAGDDGKPHYILIDQIKF